ncbi:hypothetical protein Pcinc_035978 [Petrolisthes cinctipes]|uniref:Uncharacterized protein n=1 Tax=Petrolisthes cinctipes TaxID=88211 RepID=A0AAE1BVN1_PETCI|nr:hypothetical protein Pcinc_035978 [Petrolisthes cinctipes]
MMDVKEARQNEDIDGIENGHGVIQSETLLGEMQRRETNTDENNTTVCEKNDRGLSNNDGVGSRGRKMELMEGKGMKMERREGEGQKMEMRMRESDGKIINWSDSEERTTESSENEEMMEEEELRDGGEKEDEEGNWNGDSNEKDWNRGDEEEKNDDEEEEAEETMNEQRQTAFEDVMELVGTRGPWNIFIFVLCSVGVIFNALLTLSYQFLGATPDYWCHVPGLREANWTTRQILTFAIPTNQTSAGCYMYDYNYTTAVQLGYNTSLETLTQGDLQPLTPCITREFNLTQYKSTIVTQWDLVCERRPLYSSTQAVTLLGLLAGSFVCGIVADL